MIWTNRENGKLYITISRFNQFDDHKSGKLKGKDGDIDIACEPMGRGDEYDTEILIKEIDRRLEALKSSE